VVSSVIAVPFSVMAGRQGVEEFFRPATLRPIPAS
jgi:hypothetical protein